MTSQISPSGRKRIFLMFCNLPRAFPTSPLLPIFFLIRVYIILCHLTQFVLFYSLCPGSLEPYNRGILELRGALKNSESQLLCYLGFLLLFLFLL